MITVTRVYNHGDVVEEKYTFSLECLFAVNHLLKYKKNCGIFINGICINYGYLGEERCKLLEKEWSH